MQKYSYVTQQTCGIYQVAYTVITADHTHTHTHTHPWCQDKWWALILWPHSSKMSHKETGRLYLGYGLLNLLARAGSNLNSVLWDVSKGTIVRKIHLWLLSIKLPIRKGTHGLINNQIKAQGILIGTPLPVLSSLPLSFLTMKRKVLGALSVQRSQERGMTPRIRDYRKKWTNLGKKTSIRAVSHQRVASKPGRASVWPTLPVNHAQQTWIPLVNTDCALIPPHTIVQHWLLGTDL